MKLVMVILFQHINNEHKHGKTDIGGDLFGGLMNLGKIMPSKGIDGNITCPDPATFVTKLIEIIKANCVMPPVRSVVYLYIHHNRR